MYGFKNMRRFVLEFSISVQFSYSFISFLFIFCFGFVDLLTAVRACLHLHFNFVENHIYICKCRQTYDKCTHV